MTLVVKIGIYSPYLETLGGGEKFIFSIAAYFSKKHQVEFFWDNPLLSKNAERKFSLDLSNIIFEKNIFSKSQLGKKFILPAFLSKFGVFFYVTDGSIFTSFAKKNILIVHAPNYFPRGFRNKLKLLSWQKIICYSEYVKRYLPQRYYRKTKVVYPPVEIEKFKAGRKEKIILSVGRFFGGKPHGKKQDILIKAFEKMIKKNLRGWRLILVGSCDRQGERFLKKLKKETFSYPVEFYVNVDFEVLRRLYSYAKIYWHATGFGEDLRLHPEAGEHFGIAIVEAMASGCVPVIFNGGAHPEIVKNKRSGFLWDNLEQLQDLTFNLIKSPQLVSKMAKNAQKRANYFSEKKFFKRIDEIIK